MFPLSNLFQVCLHCRVSLAPSAEICRACGARVAAPGKAASDSRPPVWITTDDYHPLVACVGRNLASGSTLGAFLMGELSRAVVCAPEWIAADVVTMNSRIAYAVGESGDVETRRLVFPDRHAPTGDTVSVLSPLGAALIGLAAGSEMSVRNRQGDAITVRVERVVYQPEAARRAQQPTA